MTTDRELEDEIVEIFGTDSIEVERTHDCNGAEEYHNGYHHYTDTVKYMITGVLADAVKARAGITGDDYVYFLEEESECGYSEYTQETDFLFEIQCGDFSKKFEDRGWVDGVYFYGHANGIAQLMSWLGEEEA